MSAGALWQYLPAGLPSTAGLPRIGSRMAT